MGKMVEETKAQPKGLGFMLIVISGLLLALIMEATSVLDRDLDWQSAVLTRGLFGTIVGVPLAWRCLNQFTYRNKLLTIRNGFNAVFLFGIYFAVSKILPADAIAITSTQPIWVAVLCIFWFGYRYFFRFWIAGLLATIGVVILVSAKPPDSLSVVALLIVITILRGAAVILLRSLKDVPPTIIALHFSVMVLISGAIVFFFSGGHHKLDTILDAKGITLLLIIGGGATFFQILQAKVAIIVGSMSTAVIIIVAVVFAYIMDIFLHHAHINGMHIFGLLLVILPTAWIVISKHVQKPIDPKK
ncbi:MAG: DMT family transporter [Phycisphaerales bacterium]|nr:DMT family transporter [Phycisphaerales bacterium]